MLKSINSTEVLAAAANLILLNSNTTSLEIKHQLRNSGYYATQSEVSTILAELVKDKKLSAVDHSSGNYKLYSVPKVSSINHSTLTSFNYKSLNPEGFYGDMQSRGSDFKVVFDALNPKNNFIFKDDVSKDSARWWFAKKSGVHLHQTRYRKIDNFAILYSTLH